MIADDTDDIGRRWREQFPNSVARGHVMPDSSAGQPTACSYCQGEGWRFVSFMGMSPQYARCEDCKNPNNRPCPALPT